MTNKSFYWIVSVGLLLGIGGCYNDAIDPTQLGRFEPTPTDGQCYSGHPGSG
jgi:hypothetical protein